jgi:FMN reductase
MLVLGIDGSPTGAGSTARAIEQVLAAASAAGATTRLLSLGPEAEFPARVEEVSSAMLDADAFVIGTPIYRASHSAMVKRLLERTPRGMWGETETPLQGRAVGLVATAASLHHFLAIGDLREALAGFFAAHVLPPGLYVPAAGFSSDGALVGDYAESACVLGQAVVRLQETLDSQPILRQLTPQV